MFSRLSSIELSMSIYLAAQLQKAERNKARAFKQGCALFSFAATIAAVLTALPQHSQSEFALSPTAKSASPIEVASILGVDAMLNQNIFVGPNRADKVDRRKTVTATAISQSFKRDRFALLEAQKRPPLVNSIDNIAVASISPVVVKANDPTNPVSFNPQDMPKMAALEAIEAITSLPAGGDLRDPSLPFPVSVPTKLAYARDAAPKTKDLSRPLTQASMDASKREAWCLATAIYFEARGESYRGQVAVAQVVRNRVKHKAYPGSLCSVVFQNQTWRNRCQFSFACDGVPERVNEAGPWKQAEEIAAKVIAGDIYLPEVANATHYHATYVSPKWAPKLRRLTKIGVHIFYRFKSS